jgi:hypothetical protein
VKTILDPRNVVPDIQESDIDCKAILTIMSKYLESNDIIYIGIADRYDDTSVRWLGYLHHAMTNRNYTSYPLDEWYVEDKLIDLLLTDKKTYGTYVYFVVLETEQDLIEFQKQFPNLNINMVKAIHQKLGLEASS